MVLYKKIGKMRQLAEMEMMQLKLLFLGGTNQSEVMTIEGNMNKKQQPTLKKNTLGIYCLKSPERLPLSLIVQHRNHYL